MTANALTYQDLEGTGDGTSLYALFDGHSGKEVAIFAAKDLPSLLVQVASLPLL
jgi:serine/threonine protein phosphatase PrpC